MRRFPHLLVLASLAAVSPAHSQTQPSPAPAAVKIPVEQFAAMPFVRKPSLSPDGRRVVARNSVNGYNRLVVLDADDPTAKPQVINIGPTIVHTVKWAGSQRLLVTVQSTGTLFGIEVPMLRLIAIDTATGSSRVLDPKSRGIYAGDVLYTDREGSWALVASQDDVFSLPSVKRVDLATGKATLVEKGKDGVWDWYADDSGVVRAGIAYEGRRWTVWYRNAAGEPLRKARGKFAKANDTAVDRVIFGRDHEAWILTNERTGRFGLYRYDLEAGAIGAPIFEHPEVDLSDVDYDYATGKIIGVSYHDDRPRVKWIDPEWQSLQAKLDRARPNATNLVVDTSDDEKRHLVWSGGASDPGVYFLLDLTSMKLSPVVEPYGIAPDHLAPVKAVRYQARDGLSIPAYLTLPRGREAKGLPLILLPHGGPFERDEWVYDPIVQFLANRGYAVLQPEFRGSTGYGKDFVSKGYGEFGRKMQDDLDDGVDWLVKSGQVDPRRVCIMGMSYGGYAAMWGAVRNPERYRCAISYAGVSDLDAMLKYDRRTFSAVRYFREWRARVAGDGKVKLAEVSPISFAARVKVPLLIAHGEADQRVPVKQSRNMVQALTKAKADVTSVFYKRSGHDFGSSEDMKDFLQRVEQFLAKNNPA